MAVIRAYIEDGYVNKKGESPVYISFYIAREKVVIPCKLSITIKAWDKVSGKVSTSDKFHADRNLIINNVKKRVNDIFVKYRLSNLPLTKEIFLKEYNNPTDFKSFFDFAVFYQKLRFQEVEPSTAVYHEGVLKKLKAFKPDLNFTNLTTDFLREYSIYLRKTLKNKDTTVNKNLSTIKIYVLDAIKRGYMNSNPFDGVAIRRSFDSTAEYLTEGELMELVRLYAAKDLPEGQLKVLGFFLFMCFTSLHISDARSITMEQITGNTLTYYRIKNRNSKPVPIRIPLSAPAKKLIRNVAGFRIKGKLFGDLMTDQKVNGCLKKIAAKAAINKKVSAKTGRHTFATIFLRRTKDVHSLQELLGHSNIQQTMVYAHVLDESKREGIEVFNDFIL